MFVFILQTLLLLLIAYILGCILGCLFHQWFGATEDASTGGASAATSGAATSSAATAGAVAAGAGAAALAAKSSASAKPAEPVAFTAAPKSTAKLVDDTPAEKPAPVAKAAPAPVAKAPAPKRKPAKAKPAAAVAAPAGKKDDLKRIKGIGPQNEARLNAVNVTLFQQIADWTKKDQAEMGERLAFPGRIEREEWVKQAKLLAAGKETQFSKRVDRGEVDSSKGKASVGDLGKKPSVLDAPKKSGADNLTLIDGVGNALEKKLNDLGIYHFSQIAKWTKANEVWIGNEINFPGRPQRENWVSESKILAAGGTTDHAKRVEKGEISSSRKSKDDEK